MVVEIPLTQGYVALVDDEDAERVRAMGKWYALKKGSGPNVRVYAVRNGRAPDKGKRGTIYLHRLLFSVESGVDVDHRNHNALDNRRANLRACTRAENIRNSRRHSDGSSRYKGVYLDKRRGNWGARLMLDGHKIHLGCFVQELDAAHAYDAAARKHFGGFAAINFPVDGEGGC